MMTRSDFVRVADEVSVMLSDATWKNDQATKDTLHKLGIRLANRFQESNPRFNRNQLLIACGVPLSLDE